MIEVRPSMPTVAELDRMVRAEAPRLEKRGIRVWLDPGIMPPDRVLLSLKQLADALGCPRQLLRQYLRERAMHEATTGESKAGLGLAAEQLAGLALGVHLSSRRSPPFWVESRSGGACSIVTPLAAGLGIWAEVEHELYHATAGMRVLVGVVDSNRGTEVCVRTGTGDLAVPPELRPHVEFYDARRLMQRYDEALGRTPLKLVSPKSCRVRLGT